MGIAMTEHDRNLPVVRLFAQLKGLTIDIEQLARQVAPVGGKLNTVETLRLLADLGFEAHRQSGSWRQLRHALLPVLIEGKGGELILLGKIDKESVLIQRPDKAEAEKVSRVALESMWNGSWIETQPLTNRQGASEAPRKFGLGWFMNALRRHRVVLGEVLLATLFVIRGTGTSRLFIFNGMFVADFLANVLKLFGYIAVAAALVYSRRYLFDRGLALFAVWSVALVGVGGVRVLRLANVRRRVTEARYAALIQDAPDGIVVTDAEGRIVLVNDRTLGIFGYEGDELLGEPIEILVPEADRTEHVLHHARYRVEPHARPMSPAAAVRGRRKDGTVFPAEVTLSPHRNGGEMMVTAIVRDVTEQRALQERLEQSERVHALGRLAGGIAHDFNNLLTVVAGVAELRLEEGLHDPESALDDLRAIQRAAATGSELTKQLLAYGRQQLVRPATLDFNEVIRTTEGMVGRLIPESIGLTVELGADTGHVHMDSGQLQRVLLNLVLNASQAVESDRRIFLATEILPGSCVVIVRDTGHGIPDEKQRRLFEPFSTTKSGGTGLGLPIVKKIVDQHSGEIRWNTSAKGTTFEMTFPRTVAPQMG